MPSASRPRDEVGELVRDPGDRVVDLLLREVSQDDRDLEPPQEEERELPGHEPCTDDADALDRRGSASGAADAALRAPLDEIECVDGRLCLRPGRSSASASSSAR